MKDAFFQGYTHIFLWWVENRNFNVEVTLDTGTFVSVVIYRGSLALYHNAGPE